MPRFFCEQIIHGRAIITNEDAKHISKVLRLSVQDPLVLCDKQGLDYHCVIESIDALSVTALVRNCVPSASEPSVKVTLYQGLPKADKLELIVQKAVELGVTHIVPTMLHRCVSKPDAQAMEKKLVRCRRIAYEAAKQSGRGIVPTIGALVSYAEALEQMAAAQRALLFYEKSNAALAQLLKEDCQSISIMIGAEGGFEEQEVEQARQRGVHILSLGPRILRCETAPLAALSAVMYQTGNL